MADGRFFGTSRTVGTARRLTRSRADPRTPDSDREHASQPRRLPASAGRAIDILARNCAPAVREPAARATPTDEKRHAVNSKHDPVDGRLFYDPRAAAEGDRIAVDELAGPVVADSHPTPRSSEEIHRALFSTR